MNTTTPLIVMARGRGERLWPLTQFQSKPSLPFADQFRMIDFVLSNGVNSNCFPIVVLAQFNEPTLATHCAQFWNSEIIYKPAESSTLVGNSSSILQYLGELPDSENIILAASDHIYQLNFQPILEQHTSLNADVTIVTAIRPSRESQEFGVLKTHFNQVTDFVEKPNPQDPILQSTDSIISLGIYIFKRTILKEILTIDHQNPDSTHDMGKDIVPLLIQKHYQVMSSNIPLSQYWKDVGTLNEYWSAHQDWSTQKDKMDSIRQTIQHSQYRQRNLIGRSRICETSSVKNCIVRDNVSIRSNCRLECIYIADNCIIESNTELKGSYSSPIFIPQNTIVNKSWIKQFSEQ